MKVLFINEILSREKLLHLFFNEKGKRASYDFPYLVNLNNDYTAEDLLQELEVNKETIEKIKSAEINGSLLIILNDNISFNKHSDQLNFDFKKSGNIQYNIFKVDLDKEEVYIKNKRVKFTDLEYRLIRLFLNNVNKIISREQIIDYLWNLKEKPKTTENNLYTHIKNLKKKITSSGADNFIHLIYRKGYIFHAPEDSIEI